MNAHHYPVGTRVTMVAPHEKAGQTGVVVWVAPGRQLGRDVQLDSGGHPVNGRALLDMVTDEDAAALAKAREATSSTTTHPVADCPACASALASAETHARATGSVAATVTHDHRDPESGQVVTDHGATFRFDTRTAAVIPPPSDDELAHPEPTGKRGPR